MSTSISRNLKKTSAVLTKDGQLLEGLTYRDFRNGVQPSSKEEVLEEVIPETKEQRKERLLKELAELE